MNNFENLEKELLNLDEIIKQCLNDIKVMPSGTVLIRHKRNSNKDYWFHFCNGQQKYLSKKKPEDEELISQLVRKSYVKKVLRTALEQKVIIERFLASYNPNAIAEVFERTSEDRKQYIEPFKTVEQEEKHIDEEELRMIKEMRSLCDEILKRKVP